MAITRNGAMEFQGLSPELNDSTMLFNWLNRASGAGGLGTMGLRSQGYANELLSQDRKRREMEQMMMREGVNKARSQGGGGSSRGEGFRGGIGAPPTRGPHGGGMSPYEQKQMQEQDAAKAAKAEREKLKKQRADDRLHMNNLLFDYEQAKSRNVLPGGSGGGKSGGSSGDEGYTEQIFNNAGAPQVVRLKNYTPDRGTEAVDMQAIMNILMGAR